MNRLEALLASHGTVLIDGAVGTTLMAEGLQQGDPPEMWNRLYPERIGAVHRAYIEAGSRIILTNSFGGNRFRLKLHDLQAQADELNRAAAEVARTEADHAPHTVLVGGSMGPTGELLEPLGNMTFAAAKAAFGEQAAGLAAGGTDLLWIETMSDVQEIRAAVEGAREVTDLPIAATLTFDTRGHTMMGISPAAALEALQPLGLAAIGANCGNGPDEIEEIIRTMHRIDPQQTLIAKSNAGIPEWTNGELFYSGTPAVMAAYAVRVREAGARLIGGCCGSSPEHIRAMADALGLGEPARPVP